MTHRALWIVVGWLTVSIPVALWAGRRLRAHSDTHPEPSPSGPPRVCPNPPAWHTRHVP